MPSYVQRSKYDIRVILPKVSSIPDKYKKKMEHLCSFNVPLSWRNLYCGIEVLKMGGITYYFLDNEYYFNRSKLYGEFDDGERVAFFSKAILESIIHLEDFMPDVIHCNDWHTALVPVFLHEQYRNLPGFENIKTVFTIHNLKFQGQFSDFVIGDICGLAGTPAEHQLRIGDSANYMQGALRYVEKITTVSPSYAEEICTKYFGEGLDWLFNERRDRLQGILNGIDTKVLDPETDKALPAAFNAADVRGKAKCKAALQEELGLEVNPGKPLFAIISRLTEQKGMDLIAFNLPMFESGDMQLVVLGKGDDKFEEAFAYYAKKYPKSICAKLEFNEALSHKIYAASDIFLMPSKFEPCGLSQLMAMRYGSLPIVRETGGLKDTVMPFNKFTKEGTGFSFSNYNAHELKTKIEEAADLYLNDKETWDSLVKQAMEKDYSWKQAAKEYRKLYASLVE
ncbi:MAG: glycogen synthase GlgA [Clostridia bacterium]|nr:glycogen synthase GlgA [Clostridia bacterium]